MDDCVIDPHTISGPIPIVSSELNAFANKSGEVNIFGGFSKDGRFGWIATDSILDVVCPRTGSRVSSYNFSRVAGSSAAITCVSDYQPAGSGTKGGPRGGGGALELLVGLRTASDKGMVCRFQPHSSRLLTVVTLPHVVTAVESVTATGGTEAPNFALRDVLRRFFGIVAVGTKGGHVYLLDIKLDEEAEFSDGARPQNAQLILPGVADIVQRRLNAAARGEHLCLDLNKIETPPFGEAYSYYSFNYCKPDGKVFKSFPIADVSVTSLTYISQLGSLAVGFSFGSFQLWRLLDTSLEYSGPLSRHPSPVTHFAYQEPEDDPQHFCYLWVARGPVLSDSKEQETLTDIHLFQMAYETKTQHPNYGHLFSDFIDCMGRFEHSLTANPLDNSEVNSLGSRLLTCYTLERPMPPGKLHDDSTAEEEVSPRDLSLAVFVWEGCPTSPDAQTSCHYVALFDLDRYYQAQMPAFIKVDDMREPPSYFSFYNLESIVEAAAPDFALNVHLDKSSLTMYQSTCQPVPEQHLHPSALNFNVVCLAEGSLVDASFLGLQRKVLAEMSEQGPSLLREPRPFYVRCWKSHLLTLANLNVTQEREALLTLALEHNLLGFLVACISSWSQGDFTSGMNLRSILEWAWGKVANVKQAVDDICTPFYDGYGSFVDSQTYKKLETFSTQLCHMVTLFQALLDQSGSTTDQGVRDLETKLGVVTLLSQHLQMVLWFTHSGLLPECGDDIGSPLEGQFCYPSTLLRQTYAQRRAELARMCRNTGNSDILLIDGLVSEAGAGLTSLWDRKEEGGTGAYPPPSLHALLDMYLLENVALATKHCIVGYLLLDVISVSSDTKHAEMIGKIEQFHQVFSLPLGLTKLLQAFWLLDHRDFEEALTMLLDPNTNNDLLAWQHTRIIKAFLYHGQAKMALQYVRCIRPTLDTPDDVKLHLTVLLANGLTAEAFQFQREYRDPSTMDELLYHIFLGSQQTKTMDQLLRLPFDDVEEAVLERYLLETSEPNSKELLVMHYLQRTRFVDAVRLNETLKQQAMMGDNDPLARERTSARNIITESYVNVLPRVQRRLAFDSGSRMKKPVGIRREVPRPKPLSTVINPAKSSKVISHALLLNAVLDRIAEARDVMKADETPTKYLDETFENSPCMEPFVGTPMTPRNKTVRSSDVSVVYPETLEPVESATYQAHSTSLNVSINQSLRSLGAMETPKALKEHFKRPPLDYSGAQALSLLQTPPVKRRVPAVRQEPQVAPPTPQSILKVRKVIRRSPSPPKMVMDRAQGLAAVEFTMPTPPQFHRKTLSFAEEDAEKPKEATPGRHIRFSDETMSPGSSSPDINQSLSEPPTFSPPRKTPSPNLENQAWATPPLSPQRGESPSPSPTDTPPFHSPQKEPEEGVQEPSPPSQQASLYPSLDQEREEGTMEAQSLILTPKQKPPTPKSSLILTPKSKPPAARVPSPVVVQEPQGEEEVFQVLLEDDDSQTPPMPDGMQLHFLSPGGGVARGDADGDEEGDEDAEVTFNFSLRQGATSFMADQAPVMRSPARPEEARQQQQEEEEEQMEEQVAMPMDAVVMVDDEADEEMETEDSSPRPQEAPGPSSQLPPDFIFQASPRQPIHSLHPFKFNNDDEVSIRPPTRALDAPGPSVTLPSPPVRASQEAGIELAFLEGTSPTSDDWQLTFDHDTEEEDEEEGGEEEEEEVESKVRFGNEEVFEIPPATARLRNILESVEIQTSPMSGLTSDLSLQQTAPPRAEVQEMSVQTTPGLALRQREIERTPQASRVSPQRMDASKLQETKASPPKGLTVPSPTQEKKTPPRSPRTPKSKAKTPPRSSPRIRARQERMIEEPSIPVQPSTPAQPSFIFSPPLTRSRGRRSTRKAIAKETAPPLAPSLTPAPQPETSLVIAAPSPSPLPGESVSTTPGRRGRGRGTRASAAANQSMTHIKEKPAARSPGRASRRSTAIHADIHSPSQDDDVTLLSPVATDGAESDSIARSLKRNPRRAVRVAPHSMTLRTPQEKKKSRKVKAW